MRTFESFSEFLSTARDFFKGPSIVSTFLHVDGVFREKIILSVSIANNCGVCTNVHSAVALALGVSREEIQNLEDMDPACFAHREWVALFYARNWAYARGKDPGGRISRQFHAEYADTEQKYIEKLLRMMKLANYTSNTLLGIPWRPELDTGPLPKKRGLFPVSLLRGPVEGVLGDLVLFSRRRAALAVNRGVKACQEVLGAPVCAVRTAEELMQNGA
ncbi:MAG: carboxymuconolactone decarboxylase family protein [Deltaproteobacteria bacterium]|nr:carboxymuconolactone decarboxylase family protein [Deltaproteobacteria bacterium]